ncbi:MAG TPA: HD domain-containing protein [Candidatus Saccharimonadales bacterium]|jgi:hypothetical protein
MLDKIVALRQHVREAAANPDFVHHKWFVKWHLEIVEKIAAELCEHYTQADRELVEVMVWLHDYGNILDIDNRREKTLSEGPKILAQLGFPAEFAQKAVSYIETMDKKLELDLRQAPVEVQIVSSADGCSHMVGPFLKIFWNEATDKTFAGKTFEELMQLDRRKIDKDWNRKIVLPEARQVFEQRYRFLLEQSGELPAKFL